MLRPPAATFELSASILAVKSCTTRCTTNSPRRPKAQKKAKFGHGWMAERFKAPVLKGPKPRKTREKHAVLWCTNPSKSLGPPPKWCTYTLSRHRFFLLAGLSLAAVRGRNFQPLTLAWGVRIPYPPRGGDWNVKSVVERIVSSSALSRFRAISK